MGSVLAAAAAFHRTAAPRRSSSPHQSMRTVLRRASKCQRQRISKSSNEHERLAFLNNNSSCGPGCCRYWFIIISRTKRTSSVWKKNETDNLIVLTINTQHFIVELGWNRPVSQSSARRSAAVINARVWHHHAFFCSSPSPCYSATHLAPSFVFINMIHLPTPRCREELFSSTWRGRHKPTRPANSSPLGHISMGSVWEAICGFLALKQCEIMDGKNKDMSSESEMLRPAELNYQLMRTTKIMH